MNEIRETKTETGEAKKEMRGDKGEKGETKT